MILLSLLEKKKKRKEALGPSNPKYREDGEFHLLIKEQRYYHGDSVRKFTSGFQWLSLMLAIMETHIKKKTTKFCELSVLGSIYSALCCEMKWMDLTITILDFAVRLYGGFELSKHLSQFLPRMQKTQIIYINPNNFFELYFELKFWTQYAMTLMLTKGCQEIKMLRYLYYIFLKKIILTALIKRKYLLHQRFVLVRIGLCSVNCTCFHKSLFISVRLYTIWNFA